MSTPARRSEYILVLAGADARTSIACLLFCSYLGHTQSDRPGRDRCPITATSPSGQTTDLGGDRWYQLGKQWLPFAPFILSRNGSFAKTGSWRNIANTLKIRYFLQVFLMSMMLGMLCHFARLDHFTAVQLQWDGYLAGIQLKELHPQITACLGAIRCAVKG